MMPRWEHRASWLSGSPRLFFSPAEATVHTLPNSNNPIHPNTPNKPNKSNKPSNPNKSNKPD